MKWSDLIPSADLLQQIEGIEEGLRKRRRIGLLGLALGLQGVRAALRRFVTHKYDRGQSVLAVYLLEPAFENRVLDHLAHASGDSASKPLTGGEIDGLNAGVRAELGDPPAEKALAPILTLGALRLTVRELLAGAFPHLPVVAYEELAPEVSLQPLGRIMAGPADQGAAGEAGNGQGD